jgi:hypothetical protein
MRQLRTIHNLFSPKLKNLCRIETAVYIKEQDEGAALTIDIGLRHTD